MNEVPHNGVRDLVRVSAPLPAPGLRGSRLRVSDSILLGVWRAVAKGVRAARVILVHEEGEHIIILNGKGKSCLVCVRKGMRHASETKCAKRAPAV
ncbi:hypothetical protein EV567_3756 [Streptomyces sp. BK239]|nr:hypothetical protein EV567_3756 [Streptomyces sp. BK239]